MSAQKVRRILRGANATHKVLIMASWAVTMGSPPFLRSKRQSDLRVVPQKKTCGPVATQTTTMRARVSAAARIKQIKDKRGVGASGAWPVTYWRG